MQSIHTELYLINTNWLLHYNKHQIQSTYIWAETPQHASSQTFTIVHLRKKWRVSTWGMWNILAILIFSQDLPTPSSSTWPASFSWSVIPVILDPIECQNFSWNWLSSWLRPCNKNLRSKRSTLSMHDVFPTVTASQSVQHTNNVFWNSLVFLLRG